MLTQSQTQDVTFQKAGKIQDKGRLFEGTRHDSDYIWYLTVPSFSVQYRFVKYPFDVRQ